MNQKPIYRREGGQLVRVKRPDAAGNATSRKVLVTHAGGSHALMTAPLDLRSRVGRTYQQRVGELTEHLGGADEVTAPQRTLIDHAARLHLLALLAWTELSRSGAFKDGSPTPAVDTYRRAAADEREVLRTMGLERRAKKVLELNEAARSLSLVKRRESSVLRTACRVTLTATLQPRLSDATKCFG